MLDIRFIRENQELVAKSAELKGYKDVDISRLIELDATRRDLSQKIDKLRTRRNEIAGSMKGGKPSEELVNEGKKVKLELTELEGELAKIEPDYILELEKVPNIPLPDVPIGSSEDENVVIKTVGEPTKFDFAPKNHAEICEAKGWLDKERAAKVAGSRFAYLKGDLVMLQWAMYMWCLSQLTDSNLIARLVKENNLNLSTKPFIPVDPPFVARTEVYEMTGRLNSEEQTYKLADDEIWLNASAEHVIAPMYIDEILPESELPYRYVGYTTAFRREAGTYGKDMEGFLRMHQFNKLEMECFTTANDSYDEHLLQIAIQEYLMSSLGLPYRVVNKCTADIGKPNARGVDIDVWLPGQGKYRETHTADLVGDYQTRRMNTRVRKSDGSLELAHTDDATALSQRPIIAIIENFQTREGDVIVPEVLRQYLGGRERI